MIIVEQDKTYLINFENTAQISLAVNEKEDAYAIMAQTIDEEQTVLGVYKTEERAKEVLQEIITRYKNWENLKAGQPTGLCLPVYEMPEE